MAALRTRRCLVSTHLPGGICSSQQVFVSDERRMNGEKKFLTRNVQRETPHNAVVHPHVCSGSRDWLFHEPDVVRGGFGVAVRAAPLSHLSWVAGGRSDPPLLIPGQWIVRSSWSADPYGDSSSTLRHVLQKVKGCKYSHVRCVAATV